MSFLSLIVNFCGAGGKTSEQRPWCGGGCSPVVQVSLGQVFRIIVDMMKKCLIIAETLNEVCDGDETERKQRLFQIA